MSDTEDASWEPKYIPDEQDEEIYCEKQELIDDMAQWLRASYRADKDAGADRVIYSDGDADVEFDILYPVGREVNKQRLFLQNLPLDKIREIHNEQKNELIQNPAQQKALDKEQFFNDSDAEADLDYWSQMEFWSLEEGLALSFGRDPKVVNDANLAMYRYKDMSFFVKRYADRRELVWRAKNAGKLSDPVLPKDFLAWAKNKDINVPPELVERVKVRGGHIDDWKAQYGEIKAQCDELARERDALARECGALRETVASLEQRQDQQLFADGYRTELMQAMERAINKFWRDYKPDDPNSAPKRDEIVAWLTKVTGSAKAADAIDLVIRHDSQKKGGKKPKMG